MVPLFRGVAHLPQWLSLEVKRRNWTRLFSFPQSIWKKPSIITCTYTYVYNIYVYRNIYIYIYYIYMISPIFFLYVICYWKMTEGASSLDKVRL